MAARFVGLVVYIYHLLLAANSHYGMDSGLTLMITLFIDGRSIIT
jgi:hypothetical protein